MLSPRDASGRAAQAVQARLQGILAGLQQEDVAGGEANLAQALAQALPLAGHGQHVDAVALAQVEGRWRWCPPAWNPARRWPGQGQFAVPALWFFSAFLLDGLLGGLLLVAGLVLLLLDIGRQLDAGDIQQRLQTVESASTSRMSPSRSTS